VFWWGNPRFPSNRSELPVPEQVQFAALPPTRWMGKKQPQVNHFFKVNVGPSKQTWGLVQNKRD